MDCFFRLLFDRLHHFGMGITGGTHSDSGVEIDVAVSIHIPEISSFGMIDHRRIHPGVRLRDVSFILGDQFFAFWTWQFGHDFRASKRFHFVSLLFLVLEAHRKPVPVGIGVVPRSKPSDFYFTLATFKISELPLMSTLSK